jgi:hypothetical protein
MKRPNLAFAILAAALAAPAPAAPAEEAVDLDMVSRIRDEGLNRSKVMETAAHLTDRIGPRLTNSPQAREATEWTRARLAEWGLANAHVETWGPFGPLGYARHDPRGTRAVHAETFLLG